ncbi:MAG: guanylate kinase [Lachnospiraceae bacterium]|nr:guanylate kinase [Lachnospiraceae bacterium]
MGKIICLLGKSSTGKDTIYKRLLAREELGLHPIVTYTTRPIRAGEKEGTEYHFTDEDGYLSLKAAGKVVEERAYHTVHGLWRYFTVDDASLDLAHNDYLIAAGTLVAYAGIRDYYGADRVVSILIDVDDGVRLQRALNRERKQEHPKYEEMCRRFLADSEDFAPEKVRQAGISTVIQNEDLDLCLSEIIAYVKCVQNGVQ